MEGGLLQNGLAIVGIVLAFIILLLVLRYGCNIAIDLCILCDPNEARRTSIEFRDRYFPCLKRRQVVPDIDEGTSPSDTTNDSSAEVAASALRRGDDTRNRRQRTQGVDALLMTLSGQERDDVLNVLLKGKKSIRWNDRHQCGLEQQDRNDKDDIESQSQPNEENGSSSTEAGGLTCSICLHEFEAESTLFVSQPCKHVFHRHCILEWCNGNNTACPYCRQPMITEAQLKHALFKLKDDKDNTNTYMT